MLLNRRKKLHVRSRDNRGLQYRYKEGRYKEASEAEREGGQSHVGRVTWAESRAREVLNCSRRTEERTLTSEP